MIDHIDRTLDEIDRITNRHGGYVVGEAREEVRSALLRLMATAVPQEKTLAQARAEVEIGKNTRDGIDCLCCDQRAKIHRRNISGSTANFLNEFINAYDRLGKPYIYVTDMSKNPDGDIQVPAGGDYAKLEYKGWELIERDNATVREDGSTRNGHWRPTERGRRFVKNELQVVKYIWDYNGDPIKDQPPCNDFVSIQDIKNVNFNFQSIMQPPPRK